MSSNRRLTSFEIQQKLGRLYNTPEDLSGDEERDNYLHTRSERTEDMNIQPESRSSSSKDSEVDFPIAFIEEDVKYVRWRTTKRTSRRASRGLRSRRGGRTTRISSAIEVDIIYIAIVTIQNGPASHTIKAYVG